MKSGKGKEKANGGNWGDDEAELVAGVLDWEGDRVLAQVLGAKFSFCQVSLHVLISRAKLKSSDRTEGTHLEV